MDDEMRDRRSFMTGGSIHDWAYDDEDSPDRDTWCTPLELARALGRWDLDPCSNARSHIQAARRFDLELRGEDALVLARFVSRGTRCFVNPPYSRGNVERFVDAYLHTRFCFLVRHDPSTEWFAKLWRASELLCQPFDRVNFESPPGVELRHKTSNPFPHVMFFRSASDAPPALTKLCYVMQPRKDLGR